MARIRGTPGNRSKPAGSTEKSASDETPKTSDEIPDWELQPITELNHPRGPGDEPWSPRPSPKSTPRWFKLTIAPFLIAAAVIGVWIVVWFATALVGAFQ